MTELEQYKKAYASLAGRVDAAISALEASSAAISNLERSALSLTAGALASALQEAEEIVPHGKPEDK